MASLDIIIVNWNAGKQLEDCLASIATHSAIDSFTLNRIVIVDNASNDDSLACLSSFSLPLTLIQNTENRGFGAACNQGAASSQADYLLFLNPDTRLFANSLNEPIRFMQAPEHQAIGICGIQLLDQAGQIARSCARFPTTRLFIYKMLALDRLFPRWFPSHFMLEWPHQETRQVDQVMGAFFLVRRPLFETLHGFDEQFFVYFEEVDLAKRAYVAGWSSFYLATAQIYHKGGGTSEQIKAKRLFYSLRSRLLYGFKHFGWVSATGLMLATLLVEPLTRLAQALLRGRMAEAGHTLQGFWLLWQALPALFHVARRIGVMSIPDGVASEGQTRQKMGKNRSL